MMSSNKLPFVLNMKLRVGSGWLEVAKNNSTNHKKKPQNL
jgi:hypothetical protein